MCIRDSHMLILVKGVIRGDIPIGYYTRKPGRWAGYLDANIFYPYAVLSLSLIHI